nr:HEPN domain-containing protein [Desulfallas thermosapovorans]
MLAQYRLQKAYDHLKSAEILLDAGMYNDSLGRSYYAMFNAARALLALKQLDSKKHSGVISLFNQHFVKSGIINRTAGRDLNKARVRRESSDYADFYLVSKEETYTQLETAKRFLKIVKLAIEKWQ